MKKQLTHCVTLLALFAGFNSTLTTSQAEPNRHSVSGAGLTTVPADFFYPGSLGFTLRQSVSAWQKEDGTVGGTVITIVDGLTSGSLHLVQDINCFTVIGNTAYFSCVIRKTSSEAEAPLGSEAVAFVTDNGNATPDITWSGPAIFFVAPGTPCSDLPAALMAAHMPQLPLTSGNYVVR